LGQSPYCRQKNISKIHSPRFLKHALEHKTEALQDQVDNLQLRLAVLEGKIA